MVQIRLTRIATHPTHGTFGVLTINSKPQCVTLEPYTNDNAVSISCIPTGQYICNRYATLKHPNTFTVSNVYGRSTILFHAGNIDDHTEGCIILGKKFGDLKNEWAVLDSRNAMADFMDRLKYDESFTLTIVENY